MKRLRNDPSEYLGGDLDAVAMTDRTVQLTRSQRNAARRESNLQWRLHDRKVGSGTDPNPRHTSYYRVQIPELADCSEWTRFQMSLCTSLHVTFRLGWMCPHIVKDALTRKLAAEFRLMAGKFIEIEGRVLQGDMVKPIDWLDGTTISGMKLAHVWQLAVDSRTLSSHTSLQGLSSFLRSEVLLGHVIRQELVSMVPAALLKVSSHHTILDVCSAPGSKTEQLLYLLQQASASEGTAGSLPTGMVVANDADPVRMGTLRSRYQRCCSPNLVATCARAEDLQKLIGRPVFDRIIADVPCSGDGTIRKFPHIWRLFRPRMALELHGLQLQIAIASALLLKPGGRMVYSTCSINPLEDEAVVSALLRHFKGALRLVDTRADGSLPRMVSSPGLSSWRCDEDIFAVGEPSEAARRATMGRLPALGPSMRPPSEEEAALMHLEYCHRILPHHNDCGGFFVAVLELCEDYSSSSSAKKECGEISELSSLEVMRRLGYNPKARSDRRGVGGGRGDGDGPSLKEEEEEEEEATGQQTVTLRSMGPEERELVMAALQLEQSGDNNTLHMWEAVATSTEDDEGQRGDDDDGGGVAELLNRLIKQQQQQKSRTRGRYHDLALAEQLLGVQTGGDRGLEIDPHLIGLTRVGTGPSSGSSSSGSRHVSLVSVGVHGALESWGPGFMRVVLQAGVRIASSIGSGDRIHGAYSSTATAVAAEDNNNNIIIPQYLLNPDCASIVLPFKTASTVVALRSSDFHAWIQLCIAIKASSLAAAKEQLSSMMAVQVDDTRVGSLLLDAAASSHETKSFTDMYCRWMMTMRTRMMRMRTTAVVHDSSSVLPDLLHDTMEEEEEAVSKLSPAAIEALLRPYLSLKEHAAAVAARHPTSRSQAAAVHIFVTLDHDAALASTTRTLLPQGEGPTVSSSSSSSSKRRMSKSERKKLKSQSSRGPIAPLQAVPITAREEEERKGVSPADHHQTLHPVIALRYSLGAVTDSRPSIVVCTAADTCLSYVTALRTTTR